MSFQREDPDYYSYHMRASREEQCLLCDAVSDISASVTKRSMVVRCVSCKKEWFYRRTDRAEPDAGRVIWLFIDANCPMCHEHSHISISITKTLAIVSCLNCEQKWPEKDKRLFYKRISHIVNDTAKEERIKSNTDSDNASFDSLINGS